MILLSFNQDEGKVFIREAADLMQNDAENILWSRYLEDFLHLRLLPEDYTDLGSEDLSIEILKKYFEPLDCECNIVRRLVSLHIHVHIHQLDGVQLISILSILTKTCVSPSIHRASSSYMVSESKHSLLRSVQPMQTPEKLLNSYQCLASFVISVLFASLQRILHKKSFISMNESHEWFSSYLNMVRIKFFVICHYCTMHLGKPTNGALCSCVILQDSSSIVKEKLYSSLGEEDSAKLIVLHCTFLAMQCCQSNQFVRAQQIFNQLHSTYFTGREVLKVWKYLLNVIIT